MELKREEGQYNTLLAPCEDGTALCGDSKAEVGPDNDHFFRSSSVVDSLDNEECLGRTSMWSHSNERTDPGPLCTDVEAACNVRCEGHSNDVGDKDNKLQPVEGSTFQNKMCRAEVDAKICSNSTSSDDDCDIDLDNCPALDLSVLQREQFEMPEATCERLPSLVEGGENTEQESFNDIHSLEQDSSCNENIKDINQIHSASLSESEGDELDLQSLEQNNDMLHDLHVLNPEKEHLMSPTWSDVNFTTSNFTLSDSGQSGSEISGLSSELMSHHERIKYVHGEEIFDSGYWIKNQDISGDNLSSDVYNSQIVYSSSLKSQRFPILQAKSQNEEKMTYDFSEENKSGTFLHSSHEFKKSGEQTFYHLNTEKSEYSNTLQMNLSENSDTVSHSNCDTVGKNSFSDNRVHHIMFYIIHITASQKSIITFHDLEVIQDPPQRTLCTLKSMSCNSERGLWLLHHLERLGFLTFHEITPVVVIVEPALHGLGGYFQQMEQGQQPTVLDSMQYEWMRVRSFWSFPRNAGVSYLQLARVGFFYTGRVSETCCYSCGQIYREWREGDDPLEIHQRISPECPHLTGREARNRPIYPDINDQWPAIPWEPFLEEAEGPLPEEEPAAGAEDSNSGTDTEQTTTLDARSQYASQETNIAVDTTQDHTSLGSGDDASSSIGEHQESSSREIDQEDLSPVLTRPAILDSTPHFEASAGDQTEAGPSLSSAEEGTSSGQTGGSDRAHLDRPSPEQEPPPPVDPNAQEQQQQEQEPRGQDPQPNNNPPGQEVGRILNPQNPPLDTTQHAAPRPDPEEFVPRGVPRADPQGNYMARYPNYVVQANRADTFLDGWPAYLNQTPYEMSSAGFFYAGNGDYCRCFYCGGGLRNWEPGDDPWVEHARWFPRCLYVRQNKGDRFVRLVQQRQENNRQNAPPRREAVLQPPPENQPGPPVELNQLQGQTTPQPNQQGQQSGEQSDTLTPTGQQSQTQQGASAGKHSIENTEPTGDDMKLSAVESLKVNGISASRIHQALQIWKRQQKTAYKMSDVTSGKLLQIVFDQEDEEKRRLAETTQLTSSPRRSVDAVAGEQTSDGAGAHFSAIASGDSILHDPEMTQNLALHNEIEERKKQLMCSVCGEIEVNVAFLPCGHLVCCSQCAPAMLTCPNCKEPVKGNVKVFLM